MNMNIHIARIILAIIAAAGLAQAAQADPQAIQSDGASPGMRLELSSAAFTPPPSDNPFDAVDTISSQAAASGAVTRDAGGSARSLISPVGGVWLFLGSIWIIGTLIHHRRVIQRH